MVTEDDITSGTWYFAGGTNYIYNKNTTKRFLDADDSQNNYNAPGSDCDKVTYYIDFC